MNKLNHFIFCIIDDVRAEHFFELIDKELLPNFKILMKNGIYSRNCITDFPSVTLPAQVTQITGTYTGDYRNEPCHGIPSYHWMGRYMAPPILRDYSGKNLQVYKMNKDLGINCQTILEMIGEGNKASLSLYINRGTNYMIPESKLQLIFYYIILNIGKKTNLRKMMARANTLVVHRLIENFKKPKKFFESNEAPIGSLLWFLSSDLLMHWFGYDSLIYKLNLMHIDKLIGLMIQELEKLGYSKDTVIAITADHGNYYAKKIGNLNEFFTHNNLTRYHPRSGLKGNMNLAEFGGVGLFNFKGVINNRNKHAWSRPTIKEMESYGSKNVNLFKELFKIEGSSLMYYRDHENTFNKGRIFLKRKDKKTGKLITGQIEYKGTGINYKTKYVSDNDNFDVFGYSQDDNASKMINNKYHTIQEWLENTYHLDFPMYPDLIPRHFKNPRSSDIILSTDGSIVYNIIHGKKKNHHKYTHDIGLRNSAVVPLIVGGSKEIPKKEIKFCKTTDIVPTLLHCLGKKSHKSVIGKNLV